jgi:hypothetical protein
MKISYDGAWPSLCSGVLTVFAEGRCWIFPRHALTSGGCAGVRGEDVYCEQGDWLVSEWPTDFPENLKWDLIDIINSEVPHGCCGGCI